MSTATDTDLQQLKDLITAGQLATQKQITDGNAATQKQISDLALNTQKQIAESALSTQQQIASLKEEIGEFKGEVKAELKGIHTELTDIKTNQKAQDTRFFSLIFLILTTAIGISAKLAKLY